MPIPWSHRLARRADRDRLAVDEDLALVRAEHAVDDVHQRRLARAVLAEQRVDLAAPQREVDGVVGRQRAEALGDAAELESELRGIRMRAGGVTAPASLLRRCPGRSA